MHITFCKITNANKQLLRKSILSLSATHNKKIILSTKLQSLQSATKKIETSKYIRCISGISEEVKEQFQDIQNVYIVKNIPIKQSFEDISSFNIIKRQHKTITVQFCSANYPTLDDLLTTITDLDSVNSFIPDYLSFKLIQQFSAVDHIDIIETLTAFSNLLRIAADRNIDEVWCGTMRIRRIYFQEIDKTYFVILNY